MDFLCCSFVLPDLASPSLPTADQLCELSFRICTKWTTVGRHLKPKPVDEMTMGEIKSQHCGNSTEQSLTMLERWQKKHGFTATVDCLVQALVEAGCKAQAQLVFGVETVLLIMKRKRGGHVRDHGEEIN